MCCITAVPVLAGVLLLPGVPGEEVCINAVSWRGCCGGTRPCCRQTRYRVLRDACNPVPTALVEQGDGARGEDLGERRLVLPPHGTWSVAEPL